MMNVYFVAEGATDQIVLQALVARWLGSVDFVPRHIQPPSSAYADGLNLSLSMGWKGVLSWCEGRRPHGRAGRDEALRLADCLIVHVDADVAFDQDFRTPRYSGPRSTARPYCDWVRDHLSSLFGDGLPANVVLCVPSMDMDAWVVCCLHPDVADAHSPIECRSAPGALLVQRAPYRLIRSKGGSLRKETARYRLHAERIAAGWPNCADDDPPRCPEAARFEDEARHVLGA